MFDLNTIAEFSRINCVAICAVMVPANLIFCLQSLILVGVNRPKNQVRLSGIIASICALMLLLHVGSWFVIGVVRVQTFILLGLSCVCLIINTSLLLRMSAVRSLILTVSEGFKGCWARVAIALS